MISLVLATGTDKRLAKRHARRGADKRDKPPPRWRRALDKGDPKIAFVVGALLTLPGASYLAALDDIIKLHPPTPVAILLVLLVNVIMLAVLELPLIGFAVAPDWTRTTIERAKRWIARDWRRFATIGTGARGAPAGHQGSDRVPHLTQPVQATAGSRGARGPRSKDPNP